VGLTVNIKVVSTDFGLVDLYVNGYGSDDDQPQIKLTAGGEACDLDRTAALRKALLEFAFSRARLAFSHGPLREAAKVAPPNYLETHEAYYRPANEEVRALKSTLAWLELSPKELKVELLPIYAEHERVSWTSLPNAPEVGKLALDERLAILASRLEGFEIFYLEMASPKAHAQGVTAIKVVIPGLEVETASYGRIGERNLHRLLEQGSPLVGLGEPPPGAARVNLTEEATLHLGRPAWFHLEKLVGKVGRLYPLYREPSRHAAPRAQM
jgi:hypothetical protein